jgi:hypothetical protein
MAFKLQNHVNYAKCIGMAGQAFQDVTKNIVEGALSHFGITP